MKILHQQFAKISAGEFSGKIFQLNHYHQHLHVAYFPGPPEQLISIDDLELVNLPFPYWRTKGEGMMVWTDQPNSKRCDTLPIPEQISLSADRVLRIKTHIKLHKEKLKKSRRKIGTAEEPEDQLYGFLERERVLESKLGTLLRNIIPITQPNKNTLLKLEQELITKNRPKMPGGNIAPPREEILQTTNTQEKPIFPLAEIYDNNNHIVYGQQIASEVLEFVLQTWESGDLRKLIYLAANQEVCELARKLSYLIADIVEGSLRRSHKDEFIKSGLRQIHYI